MPKFHCTDVGRILPSYSNTESVGGPRVVKPLVPSVRRSPKFTAVFSSAGGFPTVLKTEFPLGRAKNEPNPPRSTNVWLDDRSNASPTRGATFTAGQV